MITWSSYSLKDLAQLVDVRLATEQRSDEKTKDIRVHTSGIIFKANDHSTVPAYYWERFSTHTDHSLH